MHEPRKPVSTLAPAISDIFRTFSGLGGQAARGSSPARSIVMVWAYTALRSAFTGFVDPSPERALRYRIALRSTGRNAATAPISVAMLARVILPQKLKDSAPGPANSITFPSAPAEPSRRSTSSVTSFAVTG